jgi:hypothetical protein
MSHRRRCSLAVTAALVLLAGCTGDGRNQAVDLQPGGPPARTTWTLRHQVVESEHLKIISSSAGQYDESTGLSLVASGDESCYVTLSVPGQGGPDNKVGEKVTTQFRGRTAIRDGAGSEGPYLMWQVSGGSWLEVACEDSRSVDVAAAAVRLRASTLALPFEVASLPEGYQVAQIMQDRQHGSTDVYVGRVQPQFGLPDSDLQISLEGQDRLREPSGRAVTVNGLPALVSEEPRSPQVCVSVQAHHVCVGITASDTGPYPDRSAELPTLLAIAEQLRYAPDLEDRSTWFPAQDVFG